MWSFVVSLNAQLFNECLVLFRVLRGGFIRPKDGILTAKYVHDKRRNNGMGKSEITSRNKTKQSNAREEMLRNNAIKLRHAKRQKYNVTH